MTSDWAGSSKWHLLCIVRIKWGGLAGGTVGVIMGFAPSFVRVVMVRITMNLTALLLKLHQANLD